MYVFFILQQLPKLVHHVLLMLHEGMGVTVEGDGRVFMAEELGECLDVHAAFEGARRKGMPQRMKPLVRDMQPL